MRVAWKADRWGKSVSEDAVLIDNESHLFLLSYGMSWPCAGDLANGLFPRLMDKSIFGLLPKKIP